MSSRASFPLVAGLLLLCGCENPVSALGFERMTDQPRGKVFKASPYFADGRLMRTPPAGAVPIDGAGSRDRMLGLSGDAYASSIPLAIDRALLRRGQDRFEVYCAACHGSTGDGTSVVAAHMSLRKPPSLVDEPVRSFPPGRIFQVVSDGYGLMPSYAGALAVDERWAVVAYLRALTLSAHVTLDALPAAERHRAEEALK